MEVAERFLKYIAYNTQSDENMTSSPSTPGQLVLAKELVNEFHNIGVTNATVDAFGYVYATIEANMPLQEYLPKLGLIAHMDTSPDLSGENVKPNIIRNYNGSDILLNKEKQIIMKREEFDHLSNYIGQDLIVTDGTTLLGADDKAGIAEIMTVAEHLVSHPEVPHCTIHICFTPDEEIGKGTDHFDFEQFQADYAYTVDGSDVGEIVYDNFNGASATVSIQGNSIHPGDAKNKMINALLIAMEFNAMLPCNEVPATTEGYEGFYHITDLNGEVESAELKYILRDHDKQKLEDKKKYMQRIALYLNDKYNESVVELAIDDAYSNMKEYITPYPHLIANAERAMESLHIKPITTPLRGGTDGARLSEKGLPCPNLGTGGHNFHGKFEYISIQAMELSVELLLKIIQLYSEKTEQKVNNE